jgi:hypothetical protein
VKNNSQFIRFNINSTVIHKRDSFSILAAIQIRRNPCQPSPCGPNSQCRELHEQAVCSCLPGYQGSPPSCRPECVVSSECSSDKACQQQKCIDPCPGVCGSDALCKVHNHSPICYCPDGFQGNPFQYCTRIPPPPPEPKIPQPINPCLNNGPCGQNAYCRAVGEVAQCYCYESYIGSPPNCRPECTVSFAIS